MATEQNTPKYMPSRRRFTVLATPRSTTALGVGDPRRQDRYRRHKETCRFNVPRRLQDRMSVVRAVRDDMIDRTTFERVR
jgi:hypothetical protein